MASVREINKKSEKITFNQKLNEFVQRNRKIIFGVFFAIIIGLVGFIITHTVRDRMQINAFTQLDALNLRHEALLPYITGEDIEASRQAEINALLEDISAFAARNSGFAAARAFSLSADIYWELEKWAEAERAWAASARAASRTYLAPISAFNAAVAAEEQENIESAIAFYTQALNYWRIFPAAARAQFSIGRLEESRNNREAALEAYRDLLRRWPNDPVWSDLAQSRILVLTN